MQDLYGTLLVGGKKLIWRSGHSKIRKGTWPKMFPIKTGSGLDYLSPPGFWIIRRTL